MLDAAIFILIGVFIGRTWCAMRSLESVINANPHISRQSFQVSYAMLGQVERLRYHYCLPNKGAVVTVALQLLDRHSRAEHASFFENGEWLSVEIGPTEIGQRDVKA